MSFSNFDFLKTEWPGLHDAASNAEALAYPDARPAWFHARRGLEFLIGAQRASLAELDALFATLQPRAFIGEL